MPDAVERRLVAIVATDIEGHGALVASDETEALRAVRLHRETTRRVVTGYQGQWIEMGDGSISTFLDPINAVNCAVAIQDSLRETVPLQVGVHAGSVLFESGRRIYGADVNVALWVCSSCPVGEIRVSGEIRQALGNRPNLRASEAGELQVPKLGRRVQLYAVSGTPDPAPLGEPGPERVEHRLAAILNADVVGWSRLMAEDEEHTVATVHEYESRIRRAVRRHRGRIVDFTGDNFLAEFPSAMDAVRGAIETQRVLGEANTSLSPEQRMEFRIGLHLGDIRAEGPRIYGDGVNIAARLQAMAEPGGICISATVHDQVERKLDIGFEDLGDQSLKNIPKPVHVYRVRLHANP